METSEKNNFLTYALCFAILASAFIFMTLLSKLESASPPVTVSYTEPKNHILSDKSSENKSPVESLNSKTQNITEKDSHKNMNPASGIDINTANPEELENIPGIGPKLAEKIISYRNMHNNFQNVNELMNVDGIGEKKYKKIISYLKIFGNSEPLQTNDGQNKTSDRKKDGKKPLPETKICPRCGLHLKLHNSNDSHYKPYCTNCLLYLNENTD